MKNLADRAVGGLARFRKDEEGVTAIEYALIAGAIAVAIIAVLLILGEDVNALFQATSETQ